MCSLVTDSLSKMFGLSKVSGSWVILFTSFTGFDNLKIDFGCLTVTGFLSLLFGVCTVFYYFCNFLPLLFWTIHGVIEYFLGYFFVSLVASKAKAFLLFQRKITIFFSKACSYK